MQDLKEIIDSVQHYYSEAFSTLFYYTLALIAFSGALIPVIVAFFQNKAFKNENEKNSLEMQRVAKETELRIQANIDEYFEKKETELLEKMNEKFLENSTAFSKATAASEGKIFHVQATSELQSKKYLQCVISAMTAASEYVKADDESNLQRIIKTVEAAFAALNRQTYEESDEDVESRFERFISSVESVNQNGRYRDLIKRLRKLYSDSKNREQKE